MAIFPHPSQASEGGLLYADEIRNPVQLITAYHWGVFPFYQLYDNVWAWYALFPRLVLHPGKIHIQKSMRPYFNKPTFRISFDAAFEEVMHSCRNISYRKNDQGGWIQDDLIEKYVEMNQLGHCHSVEVWNMNGKLVGGLFGMTAGKIFCGDSMFSAESNASKMALIALAKFLENENYKLIDCQQDSPHLRSMGAELMGESTFLEMCRINCLYPEKQETWMIKGEKFLQNTYGDKIVKPGP